MAGIGSVGGGAAEGIQAGWNMGLQFDKQQSDAKQRAFENARQSSADQRQSNLDDRAAAQQDRLNSNTDDDRALAALTTQESDHAVYGAGLAHQYGGFDKIPADVGSAYATKAQGISAQRQALLTKRMQPIVDKEQAWAKDTSSRIATGQINMDDLSPEDTVRLIEATTRRPVGDYLRGENGKSVVGQGVADATAGVQTQNGALTMQGATTLLKPELSVGVGHTAADGSTITSKSLYALAPAHAPMPAGQQSDVGAGQPVQNLSKLLMSATDPNGATPPPPTPGAPAGSGSIAPQGAAAAQPGGIGQVAPNSQTDPASAAPPDQQPPVASQAPPLTPGTDADAVLPVLQVNAVHPDGTEVSYHAPVTQNRSTDPNDPVAQPLSQKALFDRMGKTSTLEAWANTPQARAKIQAGLDARGTQKDNGFIGAFYAMHGDPKALLPIGETDATSQKIRAIQAFATKNGVSFADAARQIDGKGDTGIAKQIEDIHSYAISHGLSDDAASKKLQSQGLLRAPPANAEGGIKIPANYQPDPDKPGAVMPIKGGPADPETKVALTNGQQASRQAIYTDRKMIGANEAMQDLKNISNMSTSASTGIFGSSKPGHGLLDAVRADMANTVTSQEAQSYQVMSAGFHRALATIESAGLAPSGSLTQQMDAVIWKEGDSQLTKMQKLAQTRQIIEAGMESTLTDPKLPAAQRAHIQDIVAQVQKAVPFTIADTQKLTEMQETDPNATMKDVVKANAALQRETKAAGAKAPATVKSDADYQALPSGAQYVAPDGSTRTKK